MSIFEEYVAFNSDAAPNYKYIFCPHRVRIGVLYFIYETLQWNAYNQKHCDETK